MIREQKQNLSYSNCRLSCIDLNQFSFLFGSGQCEYSVEEAVFVSPL